MLPLVKVFLLTLFWSLFGLIISASGQNGRLFGTVVYSDSRVYAARGVRVIAAGSYVKSETRTDGNGNFGFLLPAGTYKIFGQGVYPYSQRVDVMGYVRPYSDTFIVPNPLKLVHSNYRGSTPVATPVLDQRVGWREGDATSAGIMVENANLGTLFGRVVIVIESKRYRYKPARNFKVFFVGPKQQGERNTDGNGEFMLILPPGEYKITVTHSGYKPASASGVVEADKKRGVNPHPIQMIRISP